MQGVNCRFGLNDEESRFIEKSSAMTGNQRRLKVKKGDEIKEN